MSTEEIGAARPPRVGRGRISPQPEGFYAAPAPVQADGGVSVEFHGEDGRRIVFVFAGLPCPGLHADFAAAFAVRSGVTGSLRTLAAATGSWGTVRRFVVYLGGLRRPPKDVGALRPAHLAGFRSHRLLTVRERGAAADEAQVVELLKCVAGQDRLRPELREYLTRTGHTSALPRKPQIGYSDRELAAIMAAARRDVVEIRRRIRDSRELMERWSLDPGSLDADQSRTAAELAEMASTGEVPQAMRTAASGAVLVDYPGRLGYARRLFLTTADLAPLLVLGVGLSGLNAETWKELGAEHRVVGERAVAVGLTKRRRGKALSRETVHWDTGGSASRQLHTPGGYYLLLHELTAASRRFSGAERIWSIWAAGTNGSLEYRAAKARTKGHVDPFAQRLGLVLHLSRWGAGHGLTDDDGNPLTVSLGRLKTSVEVRHTKLMAGHLPSASRTNTMDVSFLSYLRDDPRIREWADEILTDALHDAENSARAFGLRVVDSATAQAFGRDPAAVAGALGTTPETFKSAAEGELDTLVASCLDFEHHPETGQHCRVSFRTCLRCANALVLERHLPALLAYTDRMQAELGRLSVDEWCGEYGINWLIVTRLILPKFTEAQRRQARQAMPDIRGWDLLEDPKEDR